MIILVEKGQTIEEVKKEFFQKSPDLIVSDTQEIQVISENKEVKTLLVDAPHNQNISKILDLFPELEYTVIQVTNGCCFRENNQKLTKKIYALYKNGHIIYFGYSNLKI